MMKILMMRMRRLMMMTPSMSMERDLFTLNNERRLMKGNHYQPSMWQLY